jgi:hypothetical protein
MVEVASEYENNSVAVPINKPAVTVRRSEAATPAGLLQRKVESETHVLASTEVDPVREAIEYRAIPKFIPEIVTFVRPVDGELDSERRETTGRSYDAASEVVPARAPTVSSTRRDAAMPAGALQCTDVSEVQCDVSHDVEPMRTAPEYETLCPRLMPVMFNCA